MRQSLQSLVVPSAIALAAIAGIGALQVPRLNALKASSAAPSLEDLQQQEAAEEVTLNLLEQTPTFGFNNLLADWVFLDFLQYFGDGPARAQTGYGLSPDYFDVILGRDPYFLDGYFFLSGSTSLYAGQPERTVEIMERELPHLSPHTPDGAYYVWRYKGVDELLFLGDSEAARQSFETAADWASTYSDPESQTVAQVSQQMADFLANNPDSKSAQVSAWTMVLSNAFDDQTRRAAIQRIQELGGEVTLDPTGQFQVSLPEKD